MRFRCNECDTFFDAAGPAEAVCPANPDHGEFVFLASGPRRVWLVTHRTADGESVTACANRVRAMTEVRAILERIVGRPSADGAEAVAVGLRAGDIEGAWQAWQESQARQATGETIAVGEFEVKQ